MASIPGTSPATAVSSTITTSGLICSAEVCAPRSPTSSSTLPTPYGVMSGYRRFVTAQNISAQPTRLSNALPTILSSPQRAKLLPNLMKSPIAIPYFSTSSWLLAPISINIFVKVSGCCFCFSVNACGATEPIIPGILNPFACANGDPVVQHRLAPPTTNGGEAQNPLSSICVTIKPTSSIWPTTATFGPRLPLRATKLPRPSKVISSTLDSSVNEEYELPVHRR